MAQQPSIKLSIDHLVVNGMSQQHAERMQAAMTKELGSLLSQSKGLESAQNLSLGNIKIPTGAALNPQHTGRTIARHIVQGLNRGVHKSQAKGGTKWA